MYFLWPQASFSWFGSQLLSTDAKPCFQAGKMVDELHLALGEKTSASQSGKPDAVNHQKRGVPSGWVQIGPI
eukprot:s182_g36.t1